MQFRGFGRRLGELHNKFDTSLLDGMCIARATGSGVVRMDIPVVNPAEPFESQKANVEEILTKSKCLLEWYLELDDDLKVIPDDKSD